MAPHKSYTAAMAPSALNTGWRMALVALAWLAGIGLQLQQPVLWTLRFDVMAMAGGLGLAIAAWALRRRQSQRAAALARWASLLALIAAAGLWGAASTDLRAQAQLATGLAPELEGRDLVLTGVIASLPHAGLSGTRFVLEVESAQQVMPSGRRDLAVPSQVPAVVSLGWYLNDRDEAFLSNPRAELRAGERWRLPVRLKRPHGSLNPEGFDVELWWWEQGVRANGYVRVVSGWLPAERLEARAGHPIERLRQSLRDSIFRHVSDQRLAGVIAALVVGDQAAIERQDWDLFRNTGIAHLMSISGLHVTMFAWVAGAAVAWAWRHCRWCSSSSCPSSASSPTWSPSPWSRWSSPPWQFWAHWPRPCGRWRRGRFRL